MMRQSTAVGGNLLFHLLALNADQLSVFAAVNAEWKAAEPSSPEEKTNAPGDGHTSDFLSGDLSSIFSTGQASRSTSSVIISSEVNDGWSSLLLRLRRRVVSRWRRCSVSWRWCVVWVGCSVHVFLKNYNKLIKYNPLILLDS